MKKKDVRSMKLTMQLKSRSYDIILKAGCLANLHQFTNVANRKVFVLTDSGVPAEYAQTVAAQCPDSTVYTIPRGEGSKCLKVYGQVLQAMLAFGMDRKDLLVSVGGKTAIDLGETKNIVGAFWQPKVVLVDFDTLKTLPRRQVVNGLAEALKTGIIGDPQLFALFECEHPEDNIEQIVYRSLKFKKKIVEQDEREGSVRACLNFGHTIGHGIEAVRGVRGRRTTGLYHGECVALGMLPMIEDTALLKRTRAIYRALGLPTRAGANKEKVLAYMQHDKKARGDHITVIKCPGLGCWRADNLPMTELPALLGME